MDNIEAAIDYYKMRFDNDVFNEMKNAFVNAFKMTTGIYAYFHEDRFETDEKKALLNDIQYCNDWKKYHDIITEIDGVDNKASNVETPKVILSRIDNIYLPGYEKKVTPRKILRVIQSPYFMIDVLSEVLYEIKAGINKDYCMIDVEDRVFQEAFINFRRNGRKKVDQSQKEKISTFKDYGYPVPINANMFIENGKPTQIENVVPNIFRLIIVSPDFRKLYGVREKKHYQLKEVVKTIDGNKLKFSALEKWKLEDIVGINLSARLTKLMGKMTAEMNLKQIEEYIMPNVGQLLISIMNGNGVFCRSHLVDILED